MCTEIPYNDPNYWCYNCVSWAVGITDHFVWPGYSLRAFDNFLKDFGFKRESGFNDTLEKGKEKVALYYSLPGHDSMFASGNRPTHMARQMADGTWSSKCGGGDFIHHKTLDLFNSPECESWIAWLYGKAKYIYSRPITKGEP